MKKICLLVAFCVTMTNAILAQNKASKGFQIVNTSNVAFIKALVSIPWQKVKEQYPILESINFKAMNGTNEIPFQLEYLGKSTVQNILLQVTIPAKSSIAVQLLKGKPLPIQSLTYGRYVPERKEDFAWENDRIAFRMYGKELEKTPAEMAYGIDVWVKRVSRLILNERYKRGDYHIDHGDGLDYYHVGFT